MQTTWTPVQPIGIRTGQSLVAEREVRVRSAETAGETRAERVEDAMVERQDTAAINVIILLIALFGIGGLATVLGFIFIFAPVYGRF